MKKSFLVIVALLMFIGTAGAQKIGYINTESILSEIPAYTMAKKAEELLAPIRARVDKAIADVARMGGYDLVIDLAAVQGVVYKNEALDLTQFVLVKYNENL